MKFSIIINATDSWVISLKHTLSLAQNMLAEGHEVEAVFFYGQAIQVVKHPDILEDWQQWQKESNCKLMLCSTLIELNQLTNLADQITGFTVVGMANWVQAIERSDRTLELC